MIKCVEGNAIGNESFQALCPFISVSLLSWRAGKRLSMKYLLSLVGISLQLLFHRTLICKNPKERNKSAFRFFESLSYGEMEVTIGWLIELINWKYRLGYWDCTKVISRSNNLKCITLPLHLNWIPIKRWIIHVKHLVSPIREHRTMLKQMHLSSECRCRKRWPAMEFQVRSLWMEAWLQVCPCHWLQNDTYNFLI